tara:strand:- start:1936 stop:2775 length:840 start_codon:yes stop_codon:yes gene_type:complete
MKLIKILIIFLFTILGIALFIQNRKKDKLDWEVVYEHTSPWQKIEFLERSEDNTYALFLNDEIQVHSEEYKLSHYLQCCVPIEKYNPKHILILGGGDLIAASFCLKYDFVQTVTLVEIDSKVVEFAKTNETFKKITNDVSKDKRLSIKIDDAIEFIENTSDTYDLIIEDIEIDFTTQKSNINMGTFLKNCLKKSPIYSGSIPCHRIKTNSQIMTRARQKNTSFITVPTTDNINTLKQLNFSETDLNIIRDIIDNSTISWCSYNYGKIYGIEAYLHITRN